LKERRRKRRGIKKYFRPSQVKAQTFNFRKVLHSASIPLTQDPKGLGCVHRRLTRAAGDREKREGGFQPILGLIFSVSRKFARLWNSSPAACHSEVRKALRFLERPGSVACSRKLCIAFFRFFRQLTTPRFNDLRLNLRHAQSNNQTPLYQERYQEQQYTRLDALDSFN
jgi:hypothetical protein